MKELNTIQTKLVAPKDKRNTFGKYDYRSLEDICEAVRPLLKETGCTLTFTDEIFFLEGRFYVKSTATLTNAEGDSVSAVGYARESDTKTGVDCAQLTGLSSSYARKYACCSLLCVSGAKDYDDLDNSEENKPKEHKELKRKPKLTVAMASDAKQPNTASLISWILEAKTADEYKTKIAGINDTYAVEAGAIDALLQTISKLKQAAKEKTTSQQTQ